MQKLGVVIVDDEPLARDELLFLLEQCEGVEVLAQAADAPRALQACEEAAPDLVFVDLKMPGPDGLALAESLFSKELTRAVVVVSAHDDGAIRAFEAGVVDYLLKPVRLERLEKAVERVRERLPPAKPAAPLTRLAVRRRGKFVVVDIDNVIFFEVKDELVWAVTADDRFALDLTLTALEKRVAQGQFFRSHRSHLVRLACITGMEPSGAGTFELHIDHPADPRIPLARERARLLRELIPIAG